MMFLLPNNLTSDSPAVDWWFRARVSFVFLIGTLAALLATFLAPAPKSAWQPAINDDQHRLLVTLDVFECFFFGIGFVFLVCGCKCARECERMWESAHVSVRAILPRQLVGFLRRELRGALTTAHNKQLEIHSLSLPVSISFTSSVTVVTALLLPYTNTKRL